MLLVRDHRVHCAHTFKRVSPYSGIRSFSVWFAACFVVVSVCVSSFSSSVGFYRLSLVNTVTTAFSFRQTGVYASTATIVISWERMSKWQYKIHMRRRRVQLGIIVSNDEV